MGGCSFVFFPREKAMFEYDLTICGKPARSSKINKPRESNANAVADAIGTPRRVKIPTMPNS